MRRTVSHVDGIPELGEEEMIHYTLRAARIQLNDEPIDTGDLFITTLRLLFIGSVSHLILLLKY